MLNSGSQNQNQTVTPDATAQNFNALRLGQANDFFGSGASLGGFGGSQPGLYGLTPGASDIASSLQSRLAPGAPLGQAMHTMGISDFPGLFQLGNNELSARSGGLSALSNAMSAIPGYQQAFGSQLGSLDQRMQQQANPEAAIAAAKDYFERIAGPSIANNLTASGLGRSGAQGEAMAMGGAQLALPIAQQSQQLGMQGLLASQAGQQALAQMGMQGASLMPGLSSAQMQLAAMPRNLQLSGLMGLGLPLAQQDLQNQTSAFQLAQMPQQLSLQDFLRRQNLATSIFTGVPVQTGQSAAGQGSQATNAGTSLLTNGLGGALSGLGLGLGAALPGLLGGAGSLGGLFGNGAANITPGQLDSWALNGVPNGLLDWGNAVSEFGF